VNTTIDSAGRVVIPRDIRNAIGLAAGAEVDIEIRDGVITIEPTPVRVKIVKRGRLWVAEPEQDLEPLTEDTVRAVRDALRGRR
jgi:AbrB family looped-hinge helix DNA binding protein